MCHGPRNVVDACTKVLRQSITTFTATPIISVVVHTTLANLAIDTGMKPFNWMSSDDLLSTHHERRSWRFDVDIKINGRICV